MHPSALSQPTRGMCIDIWVLTSSLPTWERHTQPGMVRGAKAMLRPPQLDAGSDVLLLFNALREEQQKEQQAADLRDTH